MELASILILISTSIFCIIAGYDLISFYIKNRIKDGLKKNINDAFEKGSELYNKESENQFKEKLEELKSNNRNTYYPNGNIKIEKKYWDDTDNLKSYIRYRPSGKVEIEYLYNKKGEMSSLKKFNSDGSIKVNSLYDENGIMRYFMFHGRENEKFENYYDCDGEKCTKEEYVSYTMKNKIEQIIRK